MKPYATTKHIRSKGNCRKGRPKKVARKTARRVPHQFAGFLLAGAPGVTCATY